MTLLEVAKKSGVSKSVVSDILRGDTKYSYRPDTIERVRLTALEVGYRPHSTASLMRAKRTHLIGIFSVNPRGMYSTLVADALVRELKHHTPYRSMFVDPVALREGGGASFGFELLEGLFWSLPRSDDHVLRALLSQSNAPHVVTIGQRYSRDLPVSSVEVGMSEGVAQATEHLIDLGHRQIAIIYRAPRRENERFTGFQKAMKEHDLAVNPALCVEMPEEYGPESYFRAGFEVAQQLLRTTTTRPTAILCHNDEVAVGALQGAHQLGLCIPRDLSVVGFDGVPLARYTIPPLTTVKLDVEQLAAIGVESMLAQLEAQSGARKNAPPLKRNVQCQLHVGESTATPPH